jgi:hypothetical protein
VDADLPTKKGVGCRISRIPLKAHYYEAGTEFSDRDGPLEEPLVIVFWGNCGNQHEWGDEIVIRATNHVDKRRWQHTRNGRDELQPVEKRVGWQRRDIVQDISKEPYHRAHGRSH